MPMVLQVVSLVILSNLCIKAETNSLKLYLDLLNLDTTLSLQSFFTMATSILNKMHYWYQEHCMLDFW